MASRNQKRSIPSGPDIVTNDTTQAFMGSNPTANRRGSRDQRQASAVVVDVGQLRDYKINRFNAIEPMTVTPPAVDNFGDEGERRVQVKQRGVGDALKKFQ